MSDADDVIPAIPPNMPQVPRNRFTRWIARRFLRAFGWRVVGTLPDIPKLVLIVAPHSSNWDGIWGMAAKIAMGFQVRVLGKAQLFWWPLAPLLRKLGVVPIDRSSPQGTVEQAIGLINGAERMWFALTPEGTRKRVQKWKSGFWKIARGANVPILMAYFHYPEKTIGIGGLFHPSDDVEADMAKIREWYRPWVGKNRGTV
ncbi:1-acyl-sn-glycerol-3-phosphate acyltransferases [Pseudoxanthomonas wuyuanensis]|uniref:1-acyl-sn-glycerol-3-phosphate acyltransferases n=2 Tax=Pseudoxanthomonas wuyuanensis TaxID=1073196 RepID=A0A286D8B0_9GAMM|nr:1-acyl-sn-glycerol-3-phosphate acyltransferases [Pseudoxanthomonas wuyuanensis]